MRNLWIVGGACFLAGLGLGALIPQLLEPPSAPGAAQDAAREPAPRVPVYREAPPPGPTVPAPAGSNAPAPEPGPERDLAVLAEPPTGGRPSWWTEREGPIPPVELRTNREALLAWMAEQRVEQARQVRTNFLARARLSDEESVRFDVLMAALNMRLREQSGIWRAALDQGAMTRAEIRARAMSEVSQSLVLTYDELDRTMPEGWRTAAGTNFNLMTFIEPEVWRELRPVMRGGFRGGPDRGGGPPPGPR